MRNLALFLIFIASTLVAHAEELTLESIDAKFSVPQNWKLECDGKEAFIAPIESQKQRRKIHFNISRHQSASLEDAMNAEIKGITDIRSDSSNAKAYFIDAIPLKTESGIQGLLARFAYPAEPGKERLFSNNKFYFKDSSGKIAVVCLHIWGDQELSDQFQKILMENLLSGNP